MRESRHTGASRTLDPPVDGLAGEGNGRDPGSWPRSPHIGYAWWAIAALLLVEYGLFRQFALREIVWAHPLGSDQTRYLARTYLAYEDILSSGLFHGLADSLGRTLSGSFLIHVEANLLFLLLGPSRLSALTLNFIHFALLQAVFAWSLHWLTGRWSAAFFGLGLLMTVQTPFFPVGGMADFRADFGAFCLFGVFMSVVVRSGIFVDRRWSAVAGLAAALLALYRIPTSIYLAGVASLALGLCVLRRWRSAPGTVGRSTTDRQLGGLVVAAAIFAMLAGPAFWRDRHEIWRYYALPEIGPEKAVRQAIAGIHGLGDALRFYPEALADGQLSAAFWILAGVTVAALWTLRFVSTRPLQHRALAAPVDLTSAVVFAGACLVVPLVVLTIVPIKWTLLASICVPAVLWLVMLLLVRLWPPRAESGGTRLLDDGVPWALTAIALAVGVLTHATGFGAGVVFSRTAAEELRVLQLYDVIAARSREMGWTSPRLFVDQVSDSFNWAMPIPLIYERHGRIVNFSPSVSGIWPIPEPDALAGLQRSDFVILTLVKPPGSSLYPFDRSMDALRPMLKVVCDRDLLALGTFRAYGQELILYTRHSLKMAGESSDGWITDDGITLSGSSGEVRARPRIELTGTSDFRFLPGALRASAQVSVAGRRRGEAAVTTDVSGQRYRIVVDLDPRDLPDSGSLEVRLRFEQYFVPKQLGISGDARKLVLRVPDAIRLLPGP